MVGMVAPEARTVIVYREPTEGRLLCEDARLSGEDVLPGFECRVAELVVEGRLLPDGFVCRSPKVGRRQSGTTTVGAVVTVGGDRYLFFVLVLGGSLISDKRKIQVAPSSSLALFQLPTSSMEPSLASYLLSERVNAGSSLR